LGNKALATRTASFTFLLLKAFLARLVISFFNDVFGFAFDTSCEARFQSSLYITRQFQGIPGAFKALEPATQEIRHQPFAMLIIPLVRTKSCQTSPSHRAVVVFTRYQGSRFVFVTGLVSFYTVIVFFSEKLLPTLFWHRNSPHHPLRPTPRLSLQRSRLE